MPEYDLLPLSPYAAGRNDSHPHRHNPSRRYKASHALEENKLPGAFPLHLYRFLRPTRTIIIPISGNRIG